MNKVVFHDLLSCGTSISMEFISNEAVEEVSDYKLVFSDDSSNEEFFEETESDQEFIDDFIAEEEEQGELLQEIG